MQNQQIVEIQYPQQTKLGERSDGTKFKITGTGRRCPLKSCNKVGCRKFWHEPCAAYSPGFVRQLWQMVVIVGVVEIFLGVFLAAIISRYRYDYDRIYGTEESKIISQTSLFGLITLAICGVMLLVSLTLEKRRLMWIRIMISTSLGGYIVIMSVLKVHLSLLASERLTGNNTTVLMNDACVLEVFTLLGSVIHFVGDVAVFAFYNMKFMNPNMYNTGQAEHV